MFQWRRFQFFDKTLVHATGQGKGSDVPHPLFLQLSITCCTSGRGNLVIGDASGTIYLVPRELEAKAFQAYNKTVHQLQQLTNMNLVVSLGCDDSEQENVIRVWNLDKEDKTGRPLNLKSIPIALKSHLHLPVTCMTAREDLSMMAVGFVDGSVVLVYNDVVHSAKQRLIRTADDVKVTGLGWKEAGDDSALFVVTSKSVSVFPITTFREETLDRHGCELGCALMSEEGDLVVGRPEAIYFYSPEGRGPCLAFEGEKKVLAWFRNNLIVVGEGGHMLENLNSLTIYDMKNKFNAFSGTFQNVSHVLTEWGTVFVITKERKVYQLEERDTQTKLESLFKKNFYQVAINLAQSQQYDYNSIVDIYRKFGDHLYSKGNYDGAISQYVKTIGGLEPSYVIRKFLDAQRIHNLTSYLQALHEQNRANPDHTTLLLNCYTKLKDVQKLDEFIKADSGFKFDVETAIKVCRQAGYFEHALLLAKAHVRHEWYLKILLEDTKDYSKALEYISSLQFLEAEKNMKQYGKAMMSALPQKTTQVLKELCTFYVPKKSTALGNSSGGKDVLPSSILDDLNFLEAADSSSTMKAKAENFIHIFVNQAKWLLDFLEYIVKQNEAGTSAAVYDTLLELYLEEDAIVNVDYEQQKKQRQQNLAKAMALLTNEKAVFDEQQALVLCKSLDFKQGILFLFERQHMYNEVVQYHMAHKEFDELIRACKKFGTSDSNLWIQTLSYFAVMGESCQSEIVEVLQHIEKNNMLPPLLVLQILSQNATTTLSVIKDYIVRLLEQDRQQIEEEQKHINDFSEETDKMKADIEDLRTSARIFQDNKCTVCSTPLDLPAVHFLCMHSYHLRCMGENERECPVCSTENNKILKIKSNLEANINQHEQFFKQLETSADGFATTAQYFGRGIFSGAPSSSS